MQSSRVDILARQIEAYARSHPMASDSLRGIATSWLTAVNAPASEVQAALDRLVAAGALEAVIGGAGGVPCYRRAHKP